MSAVFAPQRISGNAVYSTGAAPSTTHAASGAIVGANSVVSGTALHTSVVSGHATSGAIVGIKAVVVGSALRVPVVVTHTTTGAITGAGPRVQGFASGPSTMQVTIGGWIERKKPKATLSLPSKDTTSEAELSALREELKAHKLAKQKELRRRNELKLVLR